MAADQPAVALLLHHKGVTGVKPLGIHTGQGRKVLDTVLREPYPDAAVLTFRH